jgi:adenosylmethionine-8-amino-7-oxononanoate aminotransferase
MAAVELAGPDVGAKVDFVAKQIYEAGVIVRSQVNHLGIYPPLIIGTSEVDKIVSAIEFGLSDL